MSKVEEYRAKARKFEKFRASCCLHQPLYGDEFCPDTNLRILLDE